MTNMNQEDNRMNQTISNVIQGARPAVLASSQTNTTQNEQPAPQYEQTKQTKQTKQRKSTTSKTVLTVALSGLIGLLGGFGGGVLAYRSMASQNEPTVVYQQVPVETNTTQTTTSSTTMSLQQIAAKATPSVVEIVTETETQGYSFFGITNGIATAAGSGVILSEDGYIITNNHVVSGANTITVTTNDGTQYDATLIGTDAKSDIAVVKIEANHLQPAILGDSSLLQVGDTVLAIGNPLGTLGGTATNGIISATDRQVTIQNESMNLIQTNAAINNGNSGGGLFDANGNLIGIVNAKDSGMTSSGATIDGIGFAIPINDAIDIANQLMEYGKVVNRATIGVSLQTVMQSTGRYEAGLYITDIVPNSGAEKAGLKPGDRIIKVDGTDIMTYTELSAIVKTKNVGDHLMITVQRGSETIDCDVTLTGVLETQENQ